MKKWKIFLITGTVILAVYGMLFTPSGGQRSPDPEEDPDYKAEPILRLYTWENYWAEEDDLQQSRREVEMEPGVTYRTGQRQELKYVTTPYHKEGWWICDEVSPDLMNGFAFRNTSVLFLAEYDGRIRAEHSLRHHDSDETDGIDSGWNQLKSAATPDDDAFNSWIDNTSGVESGRDILYLEAFCSTLAGQNFHSYSSGSPIPEEFYSFDYQYLSDVYAAVPPELQNVRRPIAEITVTVYALDDLHPERYYAKAILHVRKVGTWQNILYQKLTDFGVPLKDRGEYHEITLIEYEQSDDAAEALTEN